METYTSPPHQQQLKNSITRNFGYDTSGQIEYIFNSRGFRGPELTDDDSIIIIGNSISFGIGLDFSQTFGFITAQNLQLPCANFSFGCYFHENHDYLNNLVCLSKRNNQDTLILQINNLDRRRLDSTTVIDGNDSKFCVDRFLDYFEQVKLLFKNKTLLFLYWDENHYDIPKSIKDEILICNKGHIDCSLPYVPGTFGPNTNLFISKVLTYKISRLTKK